MLKKVLKYDLKSIYKYWWIGAIASFALSLLGSFGVNFLNSEKEIPVAIEIFSNIILILTILGYIAFIFLSQILIFVRYYKNFYSDEGYLTFTLPVKRVSLFNSKLLIGSITTVATVLFCLICVGIMLMIGFRNDIFTKETYDAIVLFIQETFTTKAIITTFIIFIIEMIVACILLTIFSVLFMYLCISIGAMISKKAKVASAIGVYYGASAIGTFILTMFMIFVTSALDNWTWNLSTSQQQVLCCLLPLVLILFIGIICVALYAIHHYLLDRKLNLS